MRQKVAHVITRCMAGAGGVAVRGAVSLPSDRYESTLVVGSGDGLLDVARAHGIDVVVVPELVAPIRPTHDAQALASLVALMRSRNFDVVHTHSAKAGVLGRVAASRVRTPRIVHTLHGFPWHDFQRAPVRRTYIRIEQELSRITDAYLAVGTAVAVEAVRRGIARPEQITTIGPAVERTQILASPWTRARARSALGLGPNDLVVGTVGRLDYQKAPEVMLEAVKRATTSPTLVWVGGGSLLEEAARRCRQLGIEDRVLLLGNREDVADLLPAFDVFAMSSRYEGLPCAVVEAQDCGIPVVATCVNAVSDVVVPGVTGLLVRPEQPAQLARAIDFALTHPRDAARWVVAAREQLGQRYDSSTLGSTLCDVYELAPVARRPRPAPGHAPPSAVPA
ncbi:glycosyltransferase involved in cell wall biosynthesis [Humibacillus xanthopallidus]|uniref:Glycosyltransferase involved in cell wall biosynthesis n=1 Tax=Humibacillus xanthopallidus TaxID=412689 RepID=A0A543PPS0_9MICO|nr:glycosyltransferase [Humibacillus xanthopallidus]TQN46065.1 glycosyltransferase involved in cell wall biosynthesis [Humibacillus xanthopallidus]